jgi:RNA polymerase sigma-70 factor (ECF subfamily)
VTIPAENRYVSDVDEQDDVRSLVERARLGDESAWEELYRRVYPRLLGYARRRLFDVDEARDAVSETMVRAVGKIDRFTWTGGGFDAWLFGILRHVVLDTQRVAGRRKPVPPPDAGSGDDPLDDVLQGEEAAAVRAAFGRLDPGDQELLELRVIAGLSADEVASVLGKRAGAIRMAQSRALARLRVMLDEEVTGCAR